jgi:WD40 repeat protein/tRNA A-37 threonylcarbamoyl transferase component Bud32
VKVLRGSEFASAEAQQRFRGEAAAAARLSHPGIVGIHDFGEQDGVLWFSMDLLPGKTLADAVREHPLLAREAADCVRQVAEAVEHAHDQGVLHRDLKPSNILLTADGRPRVTDFGIARRITADTATAAADLTRTGQMLGSPGYAAPEQALAGTADVRTDVYGLGALLYHLLTGRPPFQGPTLDSILLQLRETEPVAPRRLNPTIPRDLETICLHALRKDPSRRYRSAGQLGHDLRSFLDGEPIVARPRSWAEEVLRWLKRNRAVALAALVTITALVASTVVSRREARRATATAQEARRSVYVRDMLRAQEELRQRHRAGMELLDAHVPTSSGADDLRGWEWHHLRSGTAAADLVEGGQFALAVSMAPDGRHFAQGQTKGGIKVWETATGRMVRFLPAGTCAVTSVQWLSDSRRLASCSFEADVRVHDALDGRLLVSLPAVHPVVMDLAWSPDGRWFAHADWQGTVVVRDPGGGKIQEISVPPGDIRIAWHPRRAAFAVHGPDSTSVRVHEVGKAEPSHDRPVPRGVTALAWHPDGSRFAFVDQDGRLGVVVAGDDARTVWQRQMPSDGVDLLQFTPDGTLLVSGRGNGSIAIVRADDGSEVASCIAHSTPGILSLSASDSVGVSLGKTGDLRRWEVRRKPTEGMEIRVDGAVKSLVWSHDDRFLHVVAVQVPVLGSDAYVWRHPVWDRVAGTWVPRSAGTASDLCAWSPDGKRLARAVDEAGRWSVAVEDFPEGKVTHRFPIDAPVYSLDWDRSGTRLAAGCPVEPGRHTVVCDLTDGRTTILPACASLYEQPEVGPPFEWSPDGSTMLLCDRGWHYDIRTAKAVPGWPEYINRGGMLAVLVAAWHPDRGEIAMGRETGEVEIRSAHDGSVLRRRALHGAKLRALAWYPDGKRLASASSDGTVKLLVPETLEELLTFPGPQRDVRALAWSHDGHILASGDAAGSILLRAGTQDPAAR